MRAAWDEMNGAARQVLRVGEVPDPQPAPGEVELDEVATAHEAVESGAVIGNVVVRLPERG